MLTGARVRDKPKRRYPNIDLAKFEERSLPRMVLPLSIVVVRPINFDDQPHLGASEVNDEGPDDQLPSEGESDSGTAEVTPEKLFGRSGSEAHGASSFFQGASEGRKNARASEHGHLGGSAERDGAERSRKRRFRDAREIGECTFLLGRRAGDCG